MAQLGNLIVTGVTRLLSKLYVNDSVTAPTFIGKLQGNADTATKATQDSGGQQINTTYIKGLSVSGRTITYTKGNGTTGTITTQDTNTDTKVTQAAVKDSDYTNWRSLIWGASNSGTEGFTPTTVTDQVFSSTGLSVQPSTGTIKATTFKGTLNGNASTASNASKVNNHTVNADVPSGAKFTDTVYSHPTTSGNKHIPSGGSSGQILRWSSDGTAVWGNDNNTTYTLSSITGTLAVAKGGTGSTTAAGGRSNLGAIGFVCQSTEPSGQNNGDLWFKEE